MNKIYSFAVAMCIGLVSVAQSNEQIQNKKGVDIMPVQGEYAIGLGMDLGMATGFIGNMFGGYTGSNEINTTFINNPTFGPGISVFGKYMLSDNNAIRASIYNAGSDNVTSYEVYNDRANDPDSTVVDKYRSNSSTTYVSAGYEWRRGKSRLRGVYGASAVLNWSNSHQHYTYGNAMSMTNLTPTTVFGSGVYNSTYGRIIENRNGATFGIGARAFAGIEYFVAPKICVGTEFGWSLMYSKSGGSKTTYEKFDPFTNDGEGGVVTHTQTSLGSRSISSGIDNFNTQVYFHFYF